MGFAANVLEVMISTPGDTEEEVQAVTNALHGWNTSRSKAAQTVLLPRFWKTSAVPVLSGAGGQSVINSQLVDEADIVLVLFDSKLGQETDAAVSGTAEELERAHESGTPVHVWFSDEPVARQDLDEAARLQKFRKELEGRGLLGVYSDLQDLAFKVRDAIESDLQTLGLDEASAAPKREKSEAKPRLTLASDGITLTAKNKGTATAEGLCVEVPNYGTGAKKGPIDLLPGEKYKFEFLDVLPGSVKVAMTWTTDGEEHYLNQTVSRD